MSLKLVISTLFLFFGLSSFSQPVNDNPCNAISLSVGNSCSFTNYLNLGATATGGVAAPGCAGYVGGDVWFTFTMPENGYQVTVEMGAIGITDGGMAIYSGSNCSSLTLVSCDDNSGSGNMPLLIIDDGCRFENIGATYWVRIWEDGNDNNGLFDICAFASNVNAPTGVTSCSGNLIAGDACCDAILLGGDLDGYCGNTANYNDIPNSIPGFCVFLENNSWIAFIASDTTTVLDITSSNCLFSNGIQAAILATSDCTNFTTVSNCWNPTAEGTGTLTATNLTIGETYYLMIDGWGGDECDYRVDVVSGVYTVTVTTNDAEICTGQSAQLIADVLGSGTYTYTWSPAASLDDPNSATPIASPTVSTNYTVTITGVEDSIHVVSIMVLPAVANQPIINGPDGICQNTTGMVYYANTANATDYLWTVSGSASIVGENTVDSVIVDFGLTSESVCVISNNDCGSSTQACFNVNVVSEPNISASNPPASCFGNPFDLTSIVITNSGGGGGPVTYYQNLADANAAVNPIIPPTVSVNGTYFIRMETGAFCYDVTSVVVTIEDPQIIVTDPAAKCTPDSTDLAAVTINEINGYPGGTLSFYANSLDATNATSPLSSTFVNSTNIYWARYETPNGCFDVAPINVLIDNTPDLTVLQPEPLCPGGWIDLDTITLTDANGSTYTKYFYDNLPAATIGNPAMALSNTVVFNKQSYYLRAETAYHCFQIVEIIIAPGLIPSGAISGSGVFCSDSIAPITFDLIGSGPFDVVYTDGTNLFPLNNINDGYIDFVAVNGNLTYSLVSVSDANGCNGTLNGPPIFIFEAPPVIATMTGDRSICGPGNVPLNFLLSGSAHYDITYSDGVNPPVTVSGVNFGYVEIVNVTSTTTFTLLSVSDIYGCPGFATGTATIDVTPPMQVTNTQESCDAAYNNYSVSFEVNGGYIPYNVTGGPGTWSGNIFTSDPIPAGNSYNFNVSEPGACPDEVISGIQNCPCPTDAGTMDLSLLEVCEGNTITASHNSGTEFLRPADLFQFVLHNGINTIPFIEYAVSNTPTFGIQAGMNYGTTYYISSMAGPDDGFGNIDRTHNCYSISPGTPAAFHEFPVATISGGGNICNGSSTLLTFNFTAGTPPFDVVITDGVSNFTLQDIVDGYQYSVSPLGSSNYSIVSVIDNTGAVCPGSASGTASMILVLPMQVTNTLESCDASFNNYTVSFEVNGGNTPYNVAGGPGTWSGNVFTSDSIPAGNSYNFNISDNSTCPDEIVSGLQSCICPTDAGTMDLALIEVCEGSTVTASHNSGTEFLLPVDLFQFVLHNGINTVPFIEYAVSNTPTFGMQAGMNHGTTYFISSIAGPDDGFGNVDRMHGCFSISPGTPVIFHEFPVATISGGASTCSGNPALLTFNFTAGSSPFDVVVTDGISNFTLQNIVDGYQHQVFPTVTSTYSILSVVDNTGAICPGSASGTAIINVTQQMQVTNTFESCNSAYTSYTVSFEVNAGISPYIVTGGPGTWSGNIFTSDPILAGNSYNFNISDNSTCPDEVVSGIQNCICPTDAGTMDFNLLDVCEGGTATASHNSGTEFLRSADLFQFVLHNGINTIPYIEYAVSNTPTFGIQAGMNYGATYYISAIAGPDDGFGNIDRNHNCYSISLGTPVIFHELPVATISGGATVCNGSSTFLTFNFTAGTAPFDVVYTNGISSFTIQDIIDGYQHVIFPTINSTYSIVSVVDNTGATCSGSASGTAIVNVNPPMQIINFLESCDASYNNYSVSFEVAGGNPPFNITGGAGTLSGNIFTSDPIPAGISYNFNISDNSTCPDESVSGIQNCICGTDAGTMDLNPQEGCEGSTITASPDSGTEFLLPGDLFQFALHNGLGSSPSTIYAVSNTPTFGMQAGMNYGTTYEISAMAGPDDGTGNVDRNHNCFSISPGTPVTFHELPVAAISGGATVCIGNSTFLTFSFSAGTAPFDVVYTNGISNYTLQDIGDGYQHEVFPTVTSNYTILSVIDNTGAFCPGSFSGNSAINVVDTPIESQLNIICNSTNTAFQVEFQVINGDLASYSVIGDPGVFNSGTNVFTSDWIANSSNYYFEINDVNNCGPTIVSGNYACNCTTDAGAMDVATLLVCEDVTATGQHDTGTLNFDGDDVLGFVVHDASGTQPGNILLAGLTPDFNYDPGLNFGTTYYISAVVANDDGFGFPVLDPLLDPCFSMSAGQPVVFYQTPLASISGNNAICQGDSTDIIFNIVGAGPFDIEYTTDGVNAFQLNGINDGYTLRVSPNISTDYEIISVDLSSLPNCNGLINPTNNVVSVSVTETPMISNFTINCDPDVYQYIVSFDIIGGDHNNYIVLGNSGTLSGNVFTSDPLSNGTLYSFQVDDGSGCLSQLYTDVETCNCTSDISPSISLIEEINCYGENNGILQVSNLNGVPPFNFNWNNGFNGTLNSHLYSGMYVVTMTDANSCISIDSFYLTEPTPIQAELITQDPSCYGEDDGSILFENITGGSGDYNYSLNVISSYTGNLFYDLYGGIYEAAIMDSYGCEWTSDVTLVEPLPFILKLGADQLIAYGDSAHIIPQVNYTIADKFWSSSSGIHCDTCLNQVVAPTETETYFLDLINEQGCEVSGEITINVSEEKPVYVPTAFTPDGDGFNEFFKIYCGSVVEQIRVFRVFNRWGALVYEAKNIDPHSDEFGWDGTLNGEFLENGVYIYYAEILFRNGETVINKGDVSLLSSFK